jgi:hypothetical protein
MEHDGVLLVHARVEVIDQRGIITRMRWLDLRGTTSRHLRTWPLA